MVDKISIADNNRIEAMKNIKDNKYIYMNVMKYPIILMRICGVFHQRDDNSPRKVPTLLIFDFNS